MNIYKKYDEISHEENIRVVEHSGNKEYQTHKHEFIEIIYIKSGSAVHMVNSERYKVSNGDLLIIDYEQTHSFFPDDNYSYVNILLNPEFFSNDLIGLDSIIQLFMYDMFAEFSGINSINRQHIHFEGDDKINVENLINNMLKEYNAKNIGYRSVLKGSMQILLSWILRESNFKEDNDIIQEIITYIDNNLTERIELRELAAKNFYNPSYFSRLIKEKFGKNFTAYIREKRIENAAKMLINTNMKIDEIMYNVGYRDSKTFYKHFNIVYGVSPGEYRKNN